MRRFHTGQPWFPAVFAAFLVLGAAACGGLQEARERDPGAEQARVPGAGALADAPASAEAAQTERKVVVTSNLSIEVEKLSQAYAAVSSLARSAGGFVADSNVVGEGSEGSASLRVRVPAERHDEVVLGIRDLSSRVLRESTNAREVSEQYTDLQARLRNLERTEAQFQELLTRVTSVDEILRMNERMAGVREEIEQVTGRIRLLDDLSDFATINVDMSVAAPAGSSAEASPLKVMEEAAAVSVDLAMLLLNVAVVLAFAALWLVPALLAWAAVVRAGRRLAPVAKRIIGP